MTRDLRTIPPVAPTLRYTTRGRGWGFDKDERGDSPFARNLREKTALQDNESPKPGYVPSFEDPAFNIMTGRTNFALLQMAAQEKDGQLELFPRT